MTITEKQQVLFMWDVLKRAADGKITKRQAAYRIKTMVELNNNLNGIGYIVLKDLNELNII